MPETKTEWLNRVANMHGLDPEDIEEVAEICLEDSKVCLETLQNAKDGDDLENAVRAAHSLKGSATNVGLDALSAVSKVVESALKQNDFSDYSAQVANVATELSAFENMLNS